MCREPAAKGISAAIIRELPVDSATVALIAAHLPHVLDEQHAQAKQREHLIAMATDLMLIERVSKEIIHHHIRSPTRLHEEAIRECIILKPRHFVVLAHALAGDGKFGILQDGDGDGDHKGFCCSVLRGKWGITNVPRSEAEWLDVILQRSRLNNGAVRFRFVVGASFRLVGPPEHEPIAAELATRFERARALQGQKGADLMPAFRGRAILQDSTQVATPTGARPDLHRSRSPLAGGSSFGYASDDDFLARLQIAEALDASQSAPPSPSSPSFRDDSPTWFRTVRHPFSCSRQPSPTSGVLVAA